VLTSLLCLPALAGEGGWTVVSEGPVVVKTREQSGSPVKEVWAEADLEASAYDVQQTLLEPERFPRFMPYVKEVRTLGTPDEDGGVFVYTRVAPPVIGDRDYVVKSICEEQVDEQGQGAFRQRWVSAPDRLPQRQHITRLRLNQGSWHVTPKGEKRAHVIYRFQVDPGGFVPAFAADMANRSGVRDTLKAVEREAQRRAGERMGVGGSGEGGTGGPSYLEDCPQEDGESTRQRVLRCKKAAGGE
jgi:hypothetical protein